MTEILSNGSKWAGESPDSIDTLCEVLQYETLDRIFEECGNFIITDKDCPVRFFGNFLTVSHVFSIDTDDPETISRLTDLIRSNQQTDAYLGQPDPVAVRQLRDLQSMAWMWARRTHRDGYQDGSRLIRLERGRLILHAASEQKLKDFIASMERAA